MRTESKHTPGPWIFKKYCHDAETRKRMKELGVPGGDMLQLSNDGQAVVMSEQGRICAVDCQADVKRGKGHVTECPERDANARLIAAAPALLEALRLCVKRLGRYPATDPNGETCGDMVPAEARDALALAEGTPHE